MFEVFSESARATMPLAQSNARRLGHHYIGTEHILLGLLDQPEILASRLLRDHGVTKEVAETSLLLDGPDDPDDEALDDEALLAIGIDAAAVRARIEEAFGPGVLDRPAGRQPDFPHLSFNRSSKNALRLSMRESARLRHGYVGDGHLLLGLIREGRGRAANVIQDAGINPRGLRSELDRAIPVQPSSGQGQ